MGANNSIALNRASTRLAFGQEVDYDTPWRNATFKRRASCGREGGARKRSGLVGEFGPVYAVVFGRNNPPKFTQSPGGSEDDRALIIYLPDKFCDAGVINEESISPMRFLKGPSIADRAVETMFRGDFYRFYSTSDVEMPTWIEFRQMELPRPGNSAHGKFVDQRTLVYYFGRFYPVVWSEVRAVKANPYVSPIGYILFRGGSPTSGANTGRRGYRCQ